jgi:hypothetical protein
MNKHHAGFSPYLHLLDEKVLESYARLRKMNISLHNQLV